MRADVRLTRNGNCTTITIPRAMRTHLGWLPGERMVIELLEDQSVRVRRMTADDIAPPRIPSLVFTTPAAVAK
jgi:antitoxin component of MazEF toxin-antitoxin module